MVPYGLTQSTSESGSNQGGGMYASAAESPLMRRLMGQAQGEFGRPWGMGYGGFQQHFGYGGPPVRTLGEERVSTQGVYTPEQTRNKENLMSGQSAVGTGALIKAMQQKRGGTGFDIRGPGEQAMEMAAAQRGQGQNIANRTNFEFDTAARNREMQMRGETANQSMHENIGKANQWADEANRRFAYDAQLRPWELYQQQQAQQAQNRNGLLGMMGQWAQPPDRRMATSYSIAQGEPLETSYDTA